MTTRLNTFEILLLCLTLMMASGLRSQINISNVPFTPGTENFNSYNPNSAANASTSIPSGWSFSCSGTSVFNGQTVAGTGTGGYWAYSPILTSDFDLGALRDNTTGNITYKVDYTNNTGGLITSLVFSWDYEQFRFVNTSGWACAGTGALSGNTVLPTKNLVGASSSFLNTMIITSVSSFTLSGLSIANGATFGIAWTTTDDAGADNGIGIDNFSMSANATPSISISNASISAGNLFQNSSNAVLYRADFDVVVSPATLTSASFTTAGSYSSGDLSNLKLWYSNQAIFSTSTSTLLSSLTAGLAAGNKTFGSLSKQFPVGTSYLYLTADLPCSATGNSIAVNAVSLSSFVFGTGNTYGSGFTSTPAQTFTPPSVNAVTSASLCEGKSTAGVNFQTGAANQIVYWTNSNTNIGYAASGIGNLSSITVPTVSTNETGLFTATVTSGSCPGNSISFSLMVKNNNQASSIWNGGVSSDWSDSDNWSNCSCGSITDVTVSSNGFVPLINNNVQTNNLTIDNGASVIVSNTSTLSVSGNWVNNGSFDAGAGSVELIGSATQSIGGASSNTFYNLTLSNASGATINSMSEVYGTLLLSNGTLNSNGLLSISANSLTTGKIGPISPSADIIGNVTFQQFAPGGATGWANLGVPTSFGNTFSDWNDNFGITCVNCPDGYMNFTSIYYYDEMAQGKMDSASKYVGINSISDTIQPGRGYWVYLGNGPQTTGDILFDVTGPVAKSSCLTCTAQVSIPLSFTSNNGINDDGWNLISNPLPSPISWTALRNNNPDVENAIYVFNADLNGGTGASASYINGVSSPTSGGITDNIAMCQAFYVHATAATTLFAGENVKTDSNPVFLKSSSAAAVKPVVRLHMFAPGYSDETVFYFEEGGTTSFQTDFDAYKLLSNPGTYPYLASMSDSILTAISGLPALPVNLNVPVKAISPFTSTYTFSSELENFPDNVCIRLFDTFTGISTDLRNNTYTCTIYDTTSLARFVFKVYTTPLNVLTSVLQPTCNATGSINASPVSSGSYNFTWMKDSVLVKSTENINGNDTLCGLSSGIYNLTIQSVAQCESFSQSFTIQPVLSSVASFSTNTITTQLSNGGQIAFSNSSQNAQFSIWDFGDNSGSWYVPSPTHKFQNAGTYSVTLVTESVDNCKDTASLMIQVIDDVTGVQELKNSDALKLCTLSKGNYELRFNFSQNLHLTISLYDLKGSRLISEELESVSAGSYPVVLSQAESVYLLKVQAENVEKTFKLIP